MNLKLILLTLELLGTETEPSSWGGVFQEQAEGSWAGAAGGRGERSDPQYGHQEQNDRGPENAFYFSWVQLLIS